MGTYYNTMIKTINAAVRKAPHIRLVYDGFTLGTAGNFMKNILKPGLVRDVEKAHAQADVLNKLYKLAKLQIDVRDLDGVDLKKERLTLLAKTYFEAGNYLKAIKYYGQLVKIVPRDSRNWHNLGRAYESLKRYEKAVSCFEEAIKINPENKYPHYHLIELYRKALKDPDKAIASCDEFLKIYPEDLQVLYNLGGAYWAKGNFNLAINTYKKIIALVKRKESQEITPEERERLEWAYIRVGELYFAQKNSVRAIKFYKAAIRLNPKRAHTWMKLGEAYVNLKEFKEATKCYARASDLAGLSLQP